MRPELADKSRRGRLASSTSTTRKLSLLQTIYLSAGVSVALLVWHRVHDGPIDVTTGMLFLATVCLFAFFIVETLMRTLVRSAGHQATVRLFLVTISVLLFGVALSLRYAVDRYATYWELNVSRQYLSVYEQTGSTWFHSYAYQDSVTYFRPEFTHRRKVNSFGIPEQEIDTTKAANEYRIIALGDSFTEWIGTTYDSTWVKRQQAFSEKHVLVSLRSNGTNVVSRLHPKRHCQVD